MIFIRRKRTHIAFGTLFRVGIDPVRSFRVVLTLLHPQLEQSAINRFMPFVRAPKAESLPARLAQDRAGFRLLDLEIQEICACKSKISSYLA